MIDPKTLSGPIARQAAQLFNSGDRSAATLAQLESLARQVKAADPQSDEIAGFIEAFYADGGDFFPPEADLDALFERIVDQTEPTP